MDQSTIALIILGITILLYLTEWLPLSVTTVLAMLAMAVTGIISYEDAFSGFSNSAVMLVAGMMVIGHAFFTTGLAHRIGRLLYHFIGVRERTLIVMILIIAAALSIFLNGSLTVAILMPVIDCVVTQSNGAITRKQTYFPLGVAATIGNNLTTISATSMVTANALLVQYGYPALGLFAPTMVNLPAFIVVIILYALFGYRLQKKWFDFPEVPVEAVDEARFDHVPKWKMVMAAGTLAAVVAAMLLGANYGAAALLGAAMLILTGCTSEKEAFASISWPTITVVAGAIGFSHGVDASGAGAIIAHAIIDFCGPIGKSPVGMGLVLFLVGSILSNVMSDNAAVAIIVPISLLMAESFGCDAAPLVLSAGSGIKVGIATPISVAPMTQIGVGGYRFKDYFRMGGLVNLVSLAVTSCAIWLIYF